MKQMRYCFIFVTAFLLVISSSHVRSELLQTVKPEKVGLSSQRLERIGDAIRSEIKKGNIPGAVVLVARKGKIAYFESFGMRDSEKRAPMVKDAIFRLYSMSKPIVSVAAMILQEEGRLYLSDPVAKYLPELGGLKVAVEGVDPKTGEPVVVSTVPAQRPMTIQDFLRHTSGLTYGYFGKSAVKSMYFKENVETYDQTLDELI
jgi:CubicO group peptidase (beta-lactamase class C family)